MASPSFWKEFFAYVERAERRAEERGATLARLAKKLDRSTDELQDAIDVNSPEWFSQSRPSAVTGEFAMANPVIQQLIDQVNQTQDVMQSATTLINGVADRIQAAIAAALANGATEAELAPVQAEVDELRTKTQALSDAVAANTPAAPSSAPKKKP